MSGFSDHWRAQEHALQSERNAFSRPLDPSDRHEPRRGDWMQTATGRAFYPLDPRPEDICIEDIAAGLSRQCRYAGQLREDIDHYSTAEHSVCLARYFYAQGDAYGARQALLHDASEAYLVDVPRPVKKQLAGYAEAEQRILAAVAVRFGIHPNVPQDVKDADARILLDERDVVMAKPPAPWAVDDLQPLGVKIRCLPARPARLEFLSWFGHLFPQERPSFASCETGGA